MELRPPDPPLADDAIELRPWREDDVAALVSVCNDPEIPRWTTLPSPYTEETARSWVVESTTAWKEGRFASFAIVRRDTGDLVGAVGLHPESRERPAKGEVGYWAVREHRGRGYVTRAVRLVSRWGLEELGLVRLQLCTLPGNVASERVAEKAGYRREGVLRAWVEQRGERRDATMWSLLPDELR